MAKPLIVFVTQNDDMLKAYRAYFGTRDDVVIKNLWSVTSLGNYDGGNSAPLILIGHANVGAFKTNLDPVERQNGSTVASTLKTSGLKASSYQVCLLVGCSGAGNVGKDGLFIQVGDTLGIPVIASTTTALLENMSGLDRMGATPQAGGKWKVYYPNDNEVFGLESGRCQGLREAAQSTILQLKDSDG